MPAGYYEVPGLPYPRKPMPQTPTDPNRNRDLLGNVADMAMEPDMGVGAQPPRDPYMDSLPKATPQDAATRAAVTRLQPSRTTPFSGRDAQSLAGLDQRALDEANALAGLDQPKTITGEFGGKKFEMTPAPRVDRNVLAGLYNKYQAKQGQEREDAVRGQEQAGKERIVGIPGQQMTERAKIEAEARKAESQASRADAAPEREAKVAAMQAETEAAKARLAREAQSFAERPTQAQTSADEEYNRIASSPFADTRDGQAQLARLRPYTTAGKNIPSQALPSAPTPDSATVMDQVASDPAIARALETLNKASQGWFPNAANRAAAQRLAVTMIRERLQRGGMDPALINDAVQSIINNRG